LARLPLDGRRAVYLVRVAETIYVLGASENALSKLGEMPQNSLPLTAPEPQSFADVLRRALGARSERKPAGGRKPSEGGES
jgi:flagellar biogenesis protein FliO